MQIDLHQYIVNRGAELRGTIINQTIFLERQMDEYLSLYYCNTREKQGELFDLLLGEKLSFEAKRNAIIFLLKKHNPAFLELHKNLNSDLNRIMEKRNLLAHSLLDTSHEGIEHFVKNKEIRFVKFNNKGEKPVFNSDSIVKLINDIEQCTDIFIELNKPLQTPPV